MTDATERMMSLISELYPICRSITGQGVRDTLDRIGSDHAIVRRRVASGVAVNDWVVPNEWSITDAHLTHVQSGQRVIDFADSNLHVVNYSAPVNGRFSRAELDGHLHSLPDRPTLVPYRTSYYESQWGFCLTDERLRALPDGDYDAVIDSCLSPGAVEWGEVFVPGASSDEVLITTHICHPSLCNDNLTGIAVVSEIARELLSRAQLRYSYRFLLIPGTIGSLCWLATSPEAVARVRHGLVLTGLGDSSGLTYKQSRRGSTEIDRLLDVMIRDTPDGRVLPFSPYGYDERQFCSPGYDLPVGRLSRGVHGEYPEYHTSADDLTFISADQLQSSLRFVLEVIDGIEDNRRFLNTSPLGEPQLGRRGLYSSVGGAVNSKSVEMGYLWLLSGSDGTKDLVDVAANSGLPLGAIRAAANRLIEVGLLVPAPTAFDRTTP